MWITRKGALSARAGEMGIIPGSMGAKSYIVRGKGNAAAYRSLRLKELETPEKVTEKINKISAFGGLEGVLEDLVKIRP